MCLQDVRIKQSTDFASLTTVDVNVAGKQKMASRNTARLTLVVAMRTPKLAIANVISGFYADIWNGGGASAILLGSITPAAPVLELTFEKNGPIVQGEVFASGDGEGNTMNIDGYEVFLTTSVEQLQKEM